MEMMKRPASFSANCRLRGAIWIYVHESTSTFSTFVIVTVIYPVISQWITGYRRIICTIAGINLITAKICQNQVKNKEKQHTPADSAWCRPSDFRGQKPIPLKLLVIATIMLLQQIISKLCATIIAVRPRYIPVGRFLNFMQLIQMDMKIFTASTQPLQINRFVFARCFKLPQIILT